MTLYPTETDLSLNSLTKRQFMTTQRSRILVWICAVLLLAVLLPLVNCEYSFTLVPLVLFVGPILLWIHGTKVVTKIALDYRNDLEIATAVFLDLMNVLLAGGAGIETAILAAAHSGDGWGFLQIRICITRSQSGRLSYWDGLRNLGTTYGVDSLVDVSNSVQLAGEHGARIRQSLAAKATSLRQKNLARIEYEAEQRTEKMGLPIVLLFLGFILLVGYPAFVGTIGAL